MPVKKPVCVRGEVVWGCVGGRGRSWGAYGNDGGEGGWVITNRIANTSPSDMFA